MGKRKIRDISDFKKKDAGVEPEVVAEVQPTVDEAPVVEAATAVAPQIIPQTVDLEEYGDVVSNEAVVDAVEEAPVVEEQETPTTEESEFNETLAQIKDEIIADVPVTEEMEAIDLAGVAVPTKEPEGARRFGLFKGDKKPKSKRVKCWLVTGTAEWGDFEIVTLPQEDVPIGSPRVRSDPGVFVLLGQPATPVYIISRDESGNYIPAKLEMLAKVAKSTDAGEVELAEPTPQDLFRVIECKPPEQMYFVAPTLLQKIRTYVWLAVVGVLCLLLFLIFSSLTQAQ